MKCLKGGFVTSPGLNLKTFSRILISQTYALLHFIKTRNMNQVWQIKYMSICREGKPLIVSNCLPQQQLVMKYNCGLVFENNAEFHESIITLLKDLDLRQKMGDKWETSNFKRV